MTPFESNPFESNSQGTSQRAAVLGIQVISKATGRRLGIISEVWLDLDQRQITGFSVADRYIPTTTIAIGDPFYMPLDRISLLGPDAILVDNENVLEDILTSERYTNLIGCEVITESGEPLGKVRDYQFDSVTGAISALILASVGSALIPDTLISTYELDVNEIIAVGRERIIVTEGMEERLVQLSKGILEKLGLGKPPWEQEFEDEYLSSRPSTYSDNALGSGSRVYPTQKPLYRKEEAWEEDNWQEERMPPRRARMPEPTPEPTRESRYERPNRPEVNFEQPRRTYKDQYEDQYKDQSDPAYYRNAKKEIDRAWSEEPTAPVEDLEEL